MTEEKGTQKQKKREEGRSKTKKAKFPTMSSEQAGEEL